MAGLREEREEKGIGMGEEESWGMGGSDQPSRYDG